MSVTMVLLVRLSALNENVALTGPPVML